VSKTFSLEFEYEHDYALIGIHSTLEDFRMAYFLNKHLKIQLRRFKDDLDFPRKKCKFPLFKYDNKATFTSWSLIANKYSFLNHVSSSRNILFEEEIKTSFLIPEKKTVDYFIKITGDINPGFLQNTLDKINHTYKIITSYHIDPYSLRSKDYLIF